MRVFVTGATGFIGSAIVQDLLAAGRQVLGLTRSEAGAAALEATGAKVHHGSLEDLESLRSGAAEVDGIIHTAFDHDFSRFAENCEMDRHAIKTIGAALEGSDRLLLVTSGVALLSSGRVATEEDAPPLRIGHLSPQVGSGGRRTGGGRGACFGGPSARVCPRPRRSRLRLAPHRLRARDGRVGLHGRRAQSLAGRASARRRPPVPARARAQRRRAPVSRDCRGGRAVPEHRRRDRPPLEGPVVFKPAEEAAEHFGWFALFAGMDAPASSQRTRALLGWEPGEPGLIADLDQRGYFES